MSLFISVLFLVCCTGGICHAQSLLIDEIEFTGYNIFDEDDLLKVISSSVGSKFNPKKAGTDTLRIKKFYFDRGFMDAEARYSADTVDDAVNIKFTIHENIRYKTAGINFSGLDKCELKIINAAREYKRSLINKYYDRDSAASLSERILEILKNEGYYYAELHKDSGIVISIDRLNRKTAVTVKFVNADKIYLFDDPVISIPKNDSDINQSLFLESVEFKKGEKYCRDKVLKTKRNIENFPVIQSVSLEIVNVRDSYVTIRFKVSLNKRSNYSVFIKGLRTNQNDNYIGGGAEYYNRYLFLGRGTTFSAETDILHNLRGLYIINFSAAVTTPNFYSTANTVSDRVSAGYYVQHDYSFRSLNNYLSLSRNLDKKFLFNSVIIGLSDNWIWINRITGSNSRVSTVDNIQNEHILYSSVIELILTHDGTDNEKYPASGFYFLFSPSYCGALPDLLNKIGNFSFSYSRYYKVYLAMKNYFNLHPPGNQHILAACLKIGNITEIGGGENIVSPLSIYKFISGGSSSVRGWYWAQNGNLRNKAGGGEFLFEGSVEYRLRVSPNAKSFWKDIVLAGFLDYGNVWETYDKFRIDGIALNLGFGVRWYLPQSPIRIDFGFRVYDPNSPEGTQWIFSPKTKFGITKFALHFAINEPF